MNKIYLVKEKNLIRIDKFLTENLKIYSRSKVEKIILSGNVKINGKTIIKKNFKITLGDKIEVKFPTQIKLDHIIHNENIPSLKKLYEDDQILIIDKPSGISVHPGTGERKTTILDLLINDYPDVIRIKDIDRPGIVHRLDKGTSGVLILAKSYLAMKRMQKKFKKREIFKKYYGIVSGNVRFRSGTVSAPIRRNNHDKRKFIAVNSSDHLIDEAKDAETSYSVIYQFKNSALMVFEPKTGRTHQIRVHMSYIGNPILGDDYYGKGNSFPRLALHATSIKFQHPFNNTEIISFSPTPLIFKKYYLDQIKNHNI